MSAYKRPEQVHLLAEHGKGVTTTNDVGDPGYGLRPVLKCDGLKPVKANI